MDSSSPENLPSDRKKAIEGLIQGREFANQLRIMLTKPLKDDDGSASAKVLVSKIMGSFTDTLSILNSSESDEVSQVPANTHVGSPGWDGRKSEGSGESSKTSALKDRRGCYKRRKTSHTYTRESPTLMDDGHAWRKYGQKVILHAKHPRNYYRCTHKFDQGCQATKQVQRIEDEPAMYRTTYNGHHTCQNLLKAPQIILDSTTRDSSILLCFDQSNQNPPNSNKSNDPFLPPFPLIKQEYKEEEEVVPSNLNHIHNHNHNLNLNHKQSTSSDYLLSPDHMTTFETSGPMTVLSSGSDYGDVISSGVYSCTASTHSLEMDIFMGPVDFDDAFSFEF